MRYFNEYGVDSRCRSIDLAVGAGYILAMEVVVRKPRKHRPKSRLYRCGYQMEEFENDAKQGSFWGGVGQAVAAAGRAVGTGALAAGRSAADAYLFVNPDLRRQLMQAPVLGLMSLIPSSKADANMSFDDVESRDGRAILLVHGLGGHPSHFGAIERYLRHIGGRSTRGVDLRGMDCFDQMAARLRGAIRELSEQQETGGPDKIDVVAHSMGGVVARLALEDREIRDRVATLVTMATPHGGTHLAMLADTPLTADLRPGSSVIERLEAQTFWGEVGSPELIALWSPSDTTILPPESAIWSAATAHKMEGFTHLSYFLSPRSWRFLVHLLREPAGVDGGERF